MPYGNLIEGVEWPDFATDNPEKLKIRGVLPIPKWTGLGTGDIDKPGTVLHESHHGRFQFWHSMSPDDGYTNGEVRDKIIDQAVEWYDQARQTGNTYHLGKVLHMIQDGYVLSHVKRDENGKVRGFQNYNEQDPTEHSKDEMRQVKTVTESIDIQRQVLEDWQEVPGTLNALKASADILKLYKSGASSEDLKTYLKEKVYAFENVQTQFKPSGGSDPKYQKRIAEENSVPQTDDKYAMMVEAYLNKPFVEAIELHPDLMHVYARKGAVAAEVADMHPKQQAFVLTNFDTIAVSDISQGNIKPMQINSRDFTQESPQYSRTEFT
jgi:hypothetical protein